MKRETFIVDISNSNVNWVGRRLSGFHQGNIKISKGWLTVIDGIIDDGNFTFDMSSIKVNDIYDPRLNNQLREHLLSDVFFGVEKFPNAFLQLKALFQITMEIIALMVTSLLKGSLIRLNLMQQ